MDVHPDWDWALETHERGKRKYKQTLVSLYDIRPLDDDAFMGGFIITSRTFLRFFLLLTFALTNSSYLCLAIISFFTYGNHTLYGLPTFRERGL